MIKREIFHKNLRMLSLLILLSIVSITAQSIGIPDGWSDAYVYANGIRIHYYHAVPAPGKPVIVMAHGVTDIGLCWTTLTWKLQNDFDIYMVDARGHGLSDPLTPENDREILVEDLIAFVKTINFEKPILMGHSMGAATVMQIGAKYQDLAKAIIMLDPRLINQNVESKPETEKKEPPKAPAPDQLSNSMSGTPEALVAQNNYNFDDLVATCRRQTPKWDLVDCQYWALSKKQYHGVYTNEKRDPMLNRPKASDLLPKITVPALILKADAPPEVRKANEEVASLMPNGKIVHLEETGHNLHHDDLKHTVEVLKEFFSTLQ